MSLRSGTCPLTNKLGSAPTSDNRFVWFFFSRELSLRGEEEPIVFSSPFMPCSDCGESIERATAAAHCCSIERLVEYQMFGMRDDIARFDGRLSHYLHTAAGAFEVWLAARQVRNGVR